MSETLTVVIAAQVMILLLCAAGLAGLSAAAIAAVAHGVAIIIVAMTRRLN